jgi:hypothetical protein
MKMIILTCLLFSIIANINCRLLTESSCSQTYVYYPQYPTSVVYSSTAQPTITQSYVTPTIYLPTTVTYIARKGNQSWRVSVFADETKEKDYKVKGDKYIKEKTGEQWYTHDKVDDNFKQAFARCQTLYREVKSRKAFRTQTPSDKALVSDKMPEFLEKINKDKVELKPSTPVQDNKVAISPVIASIPIVNKKSESKVEFKKTETEVKAEVKKPETANKVESSNNKVEAKISTPVNKVEAKVVVSHDNKPANPVISANKVEAKLVNAVNTPVENKKSLASQTRFLQKKHDEDKFDDEGDMEKFSGDTVAPVMIEDKKKTEKKTLIEKAEAGSSSDKNDDEDSEKEEDKKDDDDSDDEDSNDDEDKDENKDDKDENKDGDEEVPEENNELADDEKVIDSNEETEGLMDMEEEHEQEEMESDLVHDLNPYEESNPDLL